MPDVAEWTQETSRKAPLRFGAALRNDVHREIVLPEAWSASLPEAVHLDGPFLTFDLVAKKVGPHAVAVDSHYERKVAEIPPEQYPAFREAALAIQRASDVDLVLRSPEPAAIPKG